MLSSISWPHYFAAVVIITASYYLYVVFHYYQMEIDNIIHRKQRYAGLSVGSNAASFSVMGQAKLENGITVSDSQELHFDGASTDDRKILVSETMGSIKSEETPVEPVRELIQEADNLVKAFMGLNNKPEFLALLKILIDSYRNFNTDNDLQATLNEIVEISKEKLLFPVSLSDLQEIWA